MNKENNKNKLISKNRFLLTQFFRKYSYWIWPLIIGIAFLIAIVLCKVFKVNLDHLSDLTPTFIGGLFTLIGFALTIFAIIGTIDKNFYKGHLDALCKNIVFCIIFARYRRWH